MMTGAYNTFLYHKCTASGNIPEMYEFMSAGMITDNDERTKVKPFDAWEMCVRTFPGHHRLPTCYTGEMFPAACQLRAVVRLVVSVSKTYH